MGDGSSPNPERTPQNDAGGAAIDGSVHVEAGDFVGRDKIVNINNYYAASQPPAGETPVAAPPKPFEPAMLPIPGGEFLMGDGEPPTETARHSATVAAFQIAQYPVTNSEYAEFLRQARRPAPHAPGWTLGRTGWEPPAGQARHPVVGVSWDDAVAYCRWLEKETARPYRLPGEAEWEKAARGGDGRRYPWGDDPDPARCNCAESGATATATAAVDAHSPAGDSPYSCSDMAGNVWEWTNTRWGSQRGEADYRYPYRPDDGREDPAPGRGPYREYRICRGGSYRTPASQAACTARTRAAADSHDARRGFRVAYTAGNL